MNSIDHKGRIYRYALAAFLYSDVATASFEIEPGTRAAANIVVAKFINNSAGASAGVETEGA
ncbi:hypothetical protein KDW_27520 [Dictyobacter vulcani]|uniref:Uncharacterized protein n=1 Tax=Dictyobacter vulcani TaxID=2607529 RepID=A0A5J4KQ88_9CHLR|nr:hypothetical protein KDW_27520 [Dictyobacter vulcani]